MDMDVDDTGKTGGEKEKEKPIVLLLVGAPGSGKSTFCDYVMRSSARPWVRVCQDIINNGKSGTKAQCLMSAASALKEGKSVFIDRCNLQREQRADFMKLGGPQIEMHAVVLDLPAKLCISRSVKRKGHEGDLQGGRAAIVVNSMLQKKELPKLSEGFSRIMFCQNESDVQAALDTYIKLGALEAFPHGCFGQKNPDAKIQLGIMKFLKKVDVPSNARPNASSAQDSATPEATKVTKTICEGRENATSLTDTADEEGKPRPDLVVDSVRQNGSSSDVPTLAFPSISTSDFQFNHEKASDIIIEKVEEFLYKLGNAQLVLVDLSHGSKILSLVRDKAAQKNINPKKFFTFVGDITQLHSRGGLHCNVIANAANWRLKPGGGGVNAAIFSAAGPALEVATKEQTKCLSPGNAVVVPLPSSSSLYSREGVTHVIHVLGPNMNPNRPDCLDNDYVKGCKILRMAYTSLFEGFLSIVRSEEKLPKGSNEKIGSKPSFLLGHSEDAPKNFGSKSDQKIKRDAVDQHERSKKCKGSQNEFGSDINASRPGKVNANNGNIGGSKTKVWGPWAQALYNIAMHPEKHKDDLLEITDDIVVLNDLYPKAQKHLLVLARCDGLDSLADVSKEHLQLLKMMHAVGLKWAEKFLLENASLVFRLGYHSNLVLAAVTWLWKIHRCGSYTYMLLARILIQNILRIRGTGILSLLHFSVIQLM
ncbi:transcription factor bHLH140 isoform X2 [Mangifera indica]|uniref:transcription factor bHLH140 isoform X2 n=2 Tax=Mangifera indica TaxID=29780 RepID=UPI001CFB09F0|nr:transcription factor bHLH140 isoform X2 [Mangifera indica]